jgi:hypothetical protein
MNVAAIITVVPGQASLERATATQNLLLEHLGARLGSVRLAAPHLLKFACRGAIAERPDLLVIVGGSRAARQAGQAAYAHRLPILFLPGRRDLPWARQLWGSLTLEDMVAGLAKEHLRPLRIPAGVAGGKIFFGEATCGFLPELRRLRNDLAETETLSASARVLSAAAGAFSLVFGRRVRIICHGAARAVSAVMIQVQRQPDRSAARLGTFSCAAWRQGAAALAGVRLRAAASGTWRSAYEPDRFSSTKLTLQSGARTWLLLDGEAIAFPGAVELRYLPKAVQTFAFAADGEPATALLRDRFHLPPQKGPGTAGGLPRSIPGYRQQTEGRDWIQSRLKEVSPC